MSFEALESARRGAAEAILSNFGAGLEKAEQHAAKTAGTPAQRKTAAARMALEYAVLATAREKKVATEMVAGALKVADVAQQATMIKAGAAAIERIFRVEPEVLANVFAGKLTGLGMPKGLGSTPEIDKMVDVCRTLVASVIQDAYAVRGKFVTGSYEKDSFIAPLSDGQVSKAKSELAVRMAFLESAIDASAGTGAISVTSASLLKERIEAQVFEPRPPESLKFSQAFKVFFEVRGKGLRMEAMTEIRGVLQSQTVQDISTKLAVLMAARAPPADRRARSSIER